MQSSATARLSLGSGGWPAPPGRAGSSLPPHAARARAAAQAAAAAKRRAIIAGRVGERGERRAEACYLPGLMRARPSSVFTAPRAVRLPGARHTHPRRPEDFRRAEHPVPMKRRFALLQVVFSVIALAAVVWWASRQEAPQFPDTAGAIAWMGGAALLYALATLVRAERWHRILEITHIHSLARRLLRADLRRLHGQQRASRARGRGAARGADGPARHHRRRRQGGQAHAAGHDRRRADHGPDRAGRHDAGGGLRRAAREERAPLRQAAVRGRPRVPSCWWWAWWC